MDAFQIPQYSAASTFLILFGVMVLRYFCFSGIAVLTLKSARITPLSEKGPKHRQHLKDIYWSVLSSSIFAASGVWLIDLWKRGDIIIYHDFSQAAFPYHVVSFFLLLFLHDTYFYWTHRLLHHPWAFKRIHSVHHESRRPTAWTAFSFHPLEASIQAIILPLLLILVPVHWGLLGLFLSVMSITGVINHLGAEVYPRFILTRKPFCYLISATHHQLHHSRVQHNFGLYFNWWDIWMKTEHEEGTHV